MLLTTLLTLPFGAGLNGFFGFSATCVILFVSSISIRYALFFCKDSKLPFEIPQFRLSGEKRIEIPEAHIHITVPQVVPQL